MKPPPDRERPDGLTWVYEREPDEHGQWPCPGCARRHARDIEARAAPERW